MHMDISLKKNIRAAAALLLIAVIGVLVYANSFYGQFSFDSKDAILYNHEVRDFVNVAGIWKDYKTRFLPFWTFAWNHAFGGDTVFGFHVFNFTVHLITSFLVYGLVVLLLKTPRMRVEHKAVDTEAVAFWSALIFLCHPLQTQAVTYIVQRITVMAALFYILTVIFYLKFKITGEKPYYGWALFSALAAVMCKEISFTLPFALLLCELIFWGGGWQNFKAATRKLWPFFCAAALIPLFLIFSFSRDGRISGITMESNQISRGEYFLTQLNVLCTYLRMVFVPLGQNVDHDYRIVSFPGIHTLLAGALLSGILIWALKAVKKNRLLTFGIFWFFLTISVESSIIPIRDVMAEHRLYLPMAGFAVALPVFLSRIARNTKIYSILLVGIIGCWGILTFQRNQVWQNDITLWEDAVSKSPEKSRPYDNLGEAYLRAGRYDEARENLERALALDPGNDETYVNLGVILLNEGDSPAALTRFDEALAINPDSAIAYNNLGLAYLYDANVEGARQSFLKAVELGPLLAEPRLNLAGIYQNENNFDGAIKMYRQSMEISGGANGEAMALISLYFAAGQRQEALNLAENALASVKHQDQLVNIGSIFAQNGFTKVALAFYSRAMQLNSKDVEAHLELGKLYGNLGDLNKAVSVWRDGLRYAPGDERFNQLILQAQQMKGAP